MSSPKGLERNASRGYRRHQPDANRHDQREGHLDRPLGPVVREDALVEQEDGYLAEGQAECPEELEWKHELTVRTVLVVMAQQRLV